MSEQTGTQEGTEDGTGQEAPQWVKDLRKQNKELKERVDALAPLQQENLLLKQNVKLDAPNTKLFLKGWDGDWNDQEAVAAAIQEYQLPTVGAEAGEPPAGDQSQQQQTQQHPDAQVHQRIEQAAGGSQAPPPANNAPDYSQANTPEEVLAIFRQAGGLVADEVA